MLHFSIISVWGNLFQFWIIWILENLNIFVRFFGNSLFLEICFIFQLFQFEEIWESWNFFKRFRKFEYFCSIFLGFFEILLNSKGVIDHNRLSLMFLCILLAIEANKYHTIYQSWSANQSAWKVVSLRVAFVFGGRHRFDEWNPATLPSTLPLDSCPLPMLISIDSHRFFGKDSFLGFSHGCWRVFLYYLRML